MVEKSKSDLRASPIGRLVPISGHDARFGEDYEADAFVPDDLPDRRHAHLAVGAATTYCRMLLETLAARSASAT